MKTRRLRKVQQFAVTKTIDRQSWDSNMDNLAPECQVKSISSKRVLNSASATCQEVRMDKDCEASAGFCKKEVTRGLD